MFLSHKSSLEKDHYLVLDQHDQKKVLANSGIFNIISNICPHQKSLISPENGKGLRVCSYHNWSFDIDGNPVTSGRTGHYCINSTPLMKEPVYEWNSLLFSNEVKFQIPVTFTDCILLEKRIDVVNANYKIIVDLFLDVDHIQSVHNGVYDMVGITNTDVTWEYYNNGSIQKVEQGAYWITVYPYTMIEWQQGSLFITVALPIDKNTSKVLVYKYVDKKYVDSYDLNQKVWETAWFQDRKQAEAILEFTDSNLEEQKLHFRNFLNKHGIN